VSDGGVTNVCAEGTSFGFCDIGAFAGYTFTPHPGEICLPAGGSTYVCTP
jgi:hypothetical protein